MTLEELYQHRKSTPWHINEHMDILRKYASECDIVTEFGVQIGYSTVAFLSAQPLELHSYDINRHEEISEIERLAAAETRTKFVFHLMSSEHAAFETTDLIFFDSHHSYGVLSMELQLHAHKSAKYLLFHDAFAYPYFDEGESLKPTTNNYSFGRHPKGIAPAIGEYMAAHPEWKIYDQYYHQSGLTIYRRAS